MKKPLFPTSSNPAYSSKVRKVTFLKKVKANCLKVKTDDMPTVFTLAKKKHSFIELESNQLTLISRSLATLMDGST